jgi:hypothetical protein
MRAGAHQRDRSATPGLAKRQFRPRTTPIVAQEHLTWKHRNTPLSGQDDLLING